MTERFASKIVSFTPGFSPVENDVNFSETVLTVSTATAAKTVETVFHQCLSFITGLKPGVNKRPLLTGLKPGVNERPLLTGLKPGVNERPLLTGVKPGVNETSFEAKP